MALDKVNAWGEGRVPASSSSAEKTDKPKGSSNTVNKGPLLAGAVGVALLALAAYNRDSIGRALSEGASYISDRASSLDHPMDITSSTPNNESSIRALVDEDIKQANEQEGRMIAYMRAHGGCSDATCLGMYADRQRRANEILDKAARTLGKPSNQAWSVFIESIWSDPTKAPLLKTGLLYGLSLALHRASNEIGDSLYQDAAGVAYQLFSRPGWQAERNLVTNRSDPNNVQYGLFATLEREGISSFHVARRARAGGSYELVVERQFLTAMMTRLQTIHQVIESKRAAGQLNKDNVLIALNALPASPALEAVPMAVTLHAVWGRLSLPGASFNASEVVRDAVLGGRPATTVLLQEDPVGGGIVRAHDINPNEVPDPRTFVAIR